MAFITGFKTRIFDNPNDLAAFVVANVTTIYGIVTDNSGKFVLFWA